MTDAIFSGAIPALYEQYMVPMLFEPYANDLVHRLSMRPPGRVLELAAGTGVVTRAMARGLPRQTTIVATDLNQAMLDHAATVGTARAVEWRQADAQHLPFADETFDAVVCQFGAMFFPDRARAFSEVRRVLMAGGRLLFSVWDRIAENEFADEITNALEALFPDDPPRFLARTPHGCWDCSAIEQELVSAGFESPAIITTMAARSRAASARIPAVAFCHGTPLRNEIEARDPNALATATDRATAALARRFGAGVVDGKMQAHIVSVTR